MLNAVENPLFSMEFPEMVRTFVRDEASRQHPVRSAIGALQCKDFQTGCFLDHGFKDSGVCFLLLDSSKRVANRLLSVSVSGGNMPEAALVPSLIVARPEPGEYATYYEKYIDLVEGEDILTTLDRQRRQTMLLLSGRDEEDGNFRYAPDKWSAKEVLGHVCDSERVFAYRALRFSRGDSTPLAGFEQDDYVRNGPFANHPLSDLVEEFIAVRRASLSLLRTLDEAAWMRRGVANNNEVTVRALAYIIAGHELHHRRILEEKYFGAR
jgi:hypothetical protein